MNYFSHDVILPDGVHPLVRVGSALPDLWPRIPKRPLPFRLLPALRADGSADLRALADGIESHLIADEVFHAHPEFLARVDRVEQQISSFWPALEHGELAAHILVEMMLDRWLMLPDAVAMGAIPPYPPAQPAPLARYYASFSAERRAVAARFGAMVDAAREALSVVLATYAEARFLEDYSSPEGLATRFCRAWVRLPLAGGEEPPRDELTAWVERSFDSLAPRSEILIDATRAAVAPLFRA